MRRLADLPARLTLAALVALILVLAARLATAAPASPAPAADDDAADDHAAVDDAAGIDDDPLAPTASPATTNAELPPLSAAELAAVPAPPIGEVLAAAYAAAGLDHDPARDWTRRTRLAGLVPWVMVRSGRDSTWQDDDPSVGHETMFEVRATWRLDRLAFDPSELRVASIQSSRRRERRRIASRTIRVYFTWRRARAATEHHPRWRSHADEASAELDAMTDDWFGDAVARAEARARTHAVGDATQRVRNPDK
jgi:hypothetical protein